MLLLTFIQDLEKLVGLGFNPMSAILLLMVLALAGLVAGVSGFGFKFLLGERRRQIQAFEKLNQERIENKTRIFERLDECESDREDLRLRVATLDQRISNFSFCPRTNCPIKARVAAEKAAEQAAAKEEDH